MPYGIPLRKFITFNVLAFLLLAAGSQTVHNIYKPLKDMDELVQKEVKRLKAERGIKDDI